MIDKITIYEAKRFKDRLFGLMFKKNINNTLDKGFKKNGYYQEIGWNQKPYRKYSSSEDRPEMARSFPLDLCKSGISEPHRFD